MKSRHQITSRYTPVAALTALLMLLCYAPVQRAFGGESGCMEVHNAPVFAKAMNQYASELINRDPGSKRYLPLLQHILSGDAEYLRAQLDAGLDPNLSIAATALLTVAGFGCQPDVVRELLNRGASTKGLQDGAFTPLTVAAGHGANDIVSMLLAAGADPNEKASGMQQTPLSAAIDARKYDTVKILLEHGADPNVRSEVTFGGSRALEQLEDARRKAKPDAYSEIDRMIALVRSYGGYAQAPRQAKTP